MQDFTTDNFFQIIIKTFIPHPLLCTTHFTKLYLEIIKLSLDTHCLHYLALFISEYQSDTIYKDSCVPVCKLEEPIKQLSKNSSPDMDGVTAEHLTHCIGTDLINNLSVMFSLCIQCGVVPDSFRSGILVPIPKKSGCDTSEARNLRPIVISSTFSKILELYVLDKCKQHSFSEMQFEFVPKRGTNTATSLLNDVISYVTTCDSAVYTCSLDNIFHSTLSPIL